MVSFFINLQKFFIGLKTRNQKKRKKAQRSATKIAEPVMPIVMVVEKSSKSVRQIQFGY